MNPNERILIVGGGIAGLALAVGLRRLGVAPIVVEQAPAFGAVGAGISLSVNAMAALRRLGLAESARDAGRSLEAAEVLDARGRRLSRVDVRAIGERFGPNIAIHRAALHEVLLAGCGDLDLRSGTTVEKLADRGGAVEVTFSDGATAEVDRVVGADGLRSRTRTQAFGPTDPLYSGYTCWRFVVDCPPGLSVAQEMWGRGRRFGLVPLADDRLYCFTTQNAPAGTPDPTEGRIERFHARFADFGGFAPAALEQVTRPEQLIHNDLEEMPPHPWSRGRVLLVGDAAHATTPNMGQGAAMALEDVAVLCELLAGAGWDDAIPAFVARREPRVRFIVDQSRRIGRLAQIENPVAIALRNALVRMTPDRVAQRAAERAAASEM
jgi:2-polyprenyl-6-methoxyphenol hydroxylase-like FAD-dependent oxidoreductase